MGYDRGGDFVLQHYTTLTGQRDTNLDQVPFSLGLRNTRLGLRDILEVILAAINWETTVVSAGTTHAVTSDDVVLLAESSSSGTIITLPTITDGRVLVIKDLSGLAATNLVAINATAATIDDGVTTTLNLNANFGAIVLVAESTTSKWLIFATV